MQAKLDAVAEALAALMESRATEDRRLAAAHERLRDAIGPEERR